MLVISNKSYRIVYSHIAKQEIKEAAEWYNKQQKGLGKYLTDDITILQNKIRNNPFFASVEYDVIRSSSCKRFPYSIHYYIDEKRNRIVVLSFFHFSKKPYWLKE